MIRRRNVCLYLTAMAFVGITDCAGAEMSAQLYALALRQRIEQAAATQKLRDREPGNLVAIKFQVDADGRLVWRKVSSGADSALVALALRVIDAATPFRPVPPTLRDHVWTWLFLPRTKQSTVMDSGPNG